MSTPLWNALLPAIQERRDECRRLAQEFPNLRHAVILMPLPAARPATYPVNRFPGMAEPCPRPTQISALEIANQSSVEKLTWRLEPGPRKQWDFLLRIGIPDGFQGRSVFYALREDGRDFRAFDEISRTILQMLKHRPERIVPERFKPARLSADSQYAKAHVWGAAMNGILSKPPQSTSKVFARVIDVSAFEVSANALDVVTGTTDAPSDRLGEGDWLLPPRSLAAMAIAMDGMAPRKAKTILDRYQLRNWPTANRQSWTVNLLNMPPALATKMRKSKVN